MEERLFSLAQTLPWGTGSKQASLLLVRQWLWPLGSRLKQRDLGWWKTLKVGPRGFEKQEPQQGLCLPRLLGLLA